MNTQLKRYSKFMSLVLRHQPTEYGLTLDQEGWVAIDDLLSAAQQAGVPLEQGLLTELVEKNDKQRFAVSPDGLRIRARQGHSVAVELGLAPLTPPAELYHGTAERFLPSIREQGLQRGKRHHVHLSAEAETARTVGARHGRPVVLQIASAAMHADGYQFFCTENGVWLVEAVPVSYLTMP